MADKAESAITSQDNTSKSPHLAFTTISNVKLHVPIQLSFSQPNYKKWSRLFLLLVRRFNLHRYLDGSVVPISQDDDEWFQLDALLQGWILSTITDEVSDLVISSTTFAAYLWKVIHDLFHDNKHARAMQLEHQFRTTIKGNTPMATYCQTLFNIADWLDDVDAPVSQHQLVLQMLRGLLEDLQAQTSFLQFQDPLPTFLQARSALLLLERQRTSLDNHGSSALVARSGSSPHSGGYGGSHQSTGSSFSGGSQGSFGSGNGDGSSGQCSGYGRGHGRGGGNRGRGTEQTKDAMWDRIEEKFFTAMKKDGSYRTRDQLTSKWSHINKKVRKFMGVYEECSRSRRSGMNDADVLRLATTRYQDDGNQGKVPIDLWGILSRSPKWQQLNNPDGVSFRKRSTVDAEVEVDETIGLPIKSLPSTLRLPMTRTPFHGRSEERRQNPLPLVREGPPLFPLLPATKSAGQWLNNFGRSISKNKRG
ncbi:unnamed protein product [Cuscuta campestris]|uniref:No apical meristem-associated C-terminal domain-containing protein n=1 Tax=Cuscuta campestris TaxID=132261 RepID=A0A484LCK0_9ASTE|nr:unnamed protein product [Cuscuta campestris]